MEGSLDSLTNTPLVLLVSTITISGPYGLPGGIKTSLVDHPKALILQVAHNTEHAGGKLAELLQQVVLLRGVVDEVLTSPVAEPVDIQVPVQQDSSV